MRLQPTLLDRIRGSSRPAWVRGLLFRRVSAVLLATLGIAVAFAAQREPAQLSVYTAAHDLTPGTRLTDADVAVRRMPTDSLPAGAVTEIGELSGHTVTGPIHSGELLTSTRLLNSRLPQALMHRDDARLVPIEPAGSAVIGLLREGDVVDVLSETRSATDDPGQAAANSPVLARSAVVALISAPSGQSRSDGSRVVLLAMGERDAHIVATTTLTAPVTLVFH